MLQELTKKIQPGQTETTRLKSSSLTKPNQVNPKQIHF